MIHWCGHMLVLPVLTSLCLVVADAGRTLATTTNTLCTTANRNANTPTPHDPRMDFRRTTLNTKPSDNDNKSTGGGLGLCHAGVKTPSPSLSLSNSPQSVGPLSPLSSGSPSPRSVSMDSMRSDESMTSSSPGTPNEQQPTLTPQQQLHQPAHLLANTPVFPMTLPVRRRPGRPPGSTKKPRNPYDPNDRTRRMSKETGITLRKFFEAGGRDYTEFLKIEQSGANSSQIERYVPRPKDLIKCSCDHLDFKSLESYIIMIVNKHFNVLTSSGNYSAKFAM